MGYYTKLQLELDDETLYLAERERCVHSKPKGAKFCSECGAKVDNTQTLEDQIYEWLGKNLDSGYNWADFIDEPSEGMKWYDWKTYLSQLSSAFPRTLFTLHGDGEANDDQWVAYALGGNIQLEYAVVTYGKFDPDKVVEPAKLKTKH